MVATRRLTKRVTIVDDDVDIRDHTHVDWAMNSRYNAERNTVLIDDVFSPGNMYWSIRNTRENISLGSRVLCDANGQGAARRLFADPPKEVMPTGLDLSKNTSLPQFEIPKRAMLRIDRSVHWFV